MGSVFRGGFRQTLSYQLMRSAGLYAATCLDILRYPLSSLHRAARAGESLQSLPGIPDPLPQKDPLVPSPAKSSRGHQSQSSTSRCKWVQALQGTVGDIKKRTGGISGRDKTPVLGSSPPAQPSHLL